MTLNLILLEYNSARSELLLETDKSHPTLVVIEKNLIRDLYQPTIHSVKNCFFVSSRGRHTGCLSDWSSDVCSSDLRVDQEQSPAALVARPRVPHPRHQRRVVAHLAAQHVRAYQPQRDRPGRETYGVRHHLAHQQLQIGTASCRERARLPKALRHVVP